MLIFVPLNQIDDNPFQSKDRDYEVADLAADILRHKSRRPDTLGLQQVPSARLVADDGELVPTANLDNNDWLTDKNQLRPGWRVQLEFGHRRKRAFEYLATNGTYEYAKMPLNIIDLTDDDLLDGVWSENAKRKDISAVEEAELLKIKLERMGAGGSHKALGEEWGLSRPVISNRLRLLELPESIRQANRDGRLSERQALALLPILRIEQLTNGRVEWGSKVGQQWGPPAAPTAYIEHVIRNADTVTSDDVRGFTGRLMTHAGEKLPAWLAKEKFNDVPGAEQSQCKGCPFRVDQSCLKPDCLKKKLKAWPDMAVAAFSQETGIPVSDNGEHFEPYINDVKLRQRLKELYAAGEYDGMVCGWHVGGSAARPHNQRSGDYVYNVANEEDGRCGIVIGYRGQLPAAPDGQPTGPVYDLPNPDDQAAWEKAAIKIAKAAEKAMLAALSDALAYQIAEFDVIQALVCAPDAEWETDVSKLTVQLTRFLIQSGRGVGYSYNNYGTVQMYQNVLNRAGLRVNVLGSENEAVEKTAVLILSHWYSRHDGWQWERFATETQDRITAWEQLPGAAASPMAEHVARAQRHIEQKLAAEGEKVELAAKNVVDDEWTRASESVAEIREEIMAWYISQRTNDIPGQYELMKAIQRETDNHPLWPEMISRLPEGGKLVDLLEAIDHLVNYLEERVGEVAETAVSQEVSA
ncbi:MAG: hypothetical protein R3D55_25915 [Chloroflexota bacterium]